jgi:hypothetical protein
MRQKPVAVIIGIDRSGDCPAPPNIKEIAGQRILDIGGIATAVGDIDRAIRALRKSKASRPGRW